MINPDNTKSPYRYATLTVWEEGCQDWHEGLHVNPYAKDTLQHEEWRKGHFYAETVFGETQHLEPSHA